MAKLKVLMNALSKALENIPEKVGALSNLKKQQLEQDAFAKSQYNYPATEELLNHYQARDVRKLISQKEYEEWYKNYSKKFKNENFDPQTYFHVTRKDFTNFKPETKKGEGLFNPEIEIKDDTRGASFFTADKNYVGDITEMLEEDFGSEGLRIMPVKIKMRNIFHGDKEQISQLEDKFKNMSSEELEEFNKYKKMSDDYFGEETIDDYFTQISQGVYHKLDNPIIRKKMKELGFTGFITDEPDTVALFYPDKGDVRSINAKFDPKKAEDGDIMASIIAPVATVGTLGALSGLEDST